MNYEQTIAKLVEHYVEKWGEGERKASEKLCRKNCPTIGLAINKLAHLDPDNINKQLASCAAKLLTADDWVELRKGG